MSTGLIGITNRGDAQGNPHMAYSFTPTSDEVATHVEGSIGTGGTATWNIGISLAKPTDLSAPGFVAYGVLVFTAESGTKQVALDAPYSLVGGTTYWLTAVRQSGSVSLGAETGVPSTNLVSAVSSGLYYNASSSPNPATGLTGPFGAPNWGPCFSLYADGSGAPVLTIVATPDDATGTVLLEVTNAAAPGVAVYESDFSAGVDSWSSDSDDPGVDPPDLVASAGLLAIGNVDTWWLQDQWLERTVTGLTIGVTYRAEVTLRNDASFYALYPYVGVQGVGAGSAGPASPNGGTRTVTYDWEATGTSHVLEVRRLNGAAPFDSYSRMVSATVTIRPAGLQQLQIQRTDANGTHFVRLFADTEPETDGSLEVTDAEAALGAVSYVVRDGLGDVASDSATLATAVPVLCSVGYTDTLLVARVDGYDEQRSYSPTVDVLPIIGRAEPLATDRGEAVWSKRTGTLLYAPQASYADAQGLVDLYTAGRVMMLRQPTHPGMDLYHVTTHIRVEPVYLADDGWRWQVQAEFVEVGWPDGDLRGSADWTYDALELSALAYYNLLDDWADYAELEAGP